MPGDMWSERMVWESLLAPKSGGHVTATWQNQWLRPGVPLYRELTLTVTCLGETLELKAYWYNAERQQVFIRPVLPPRQRPRWKLARLCLIDDHPGLPHFHFFEDNPFGMAEVRWLRPDLPHSMNAIDLLFDAFTQDLNVVEFSLKEGMLSER